MDQKAELSWSTSDGRGPIHAAAHGGHVAMVEHLGSRGAEVEAESSSGIKKDNDAVSMRPLHLAAHAGHLAVLAHFATGGREEKKKGTRSALEFHHIPGLHDIASDQGHLAVTQYLQEHTLRRHKKAEL